MALYRYVGNRAKGDGTTNLHFKSSTGSIYDVSVGSTVELSADDLTKLNRKYVFQESDGTPVAPNPVAGSSFTEDQAREIFATKAQVDALSAASVTSEDVQHIVETYSRSVPYDETKFYPSGSIISTSSEDPDLGTVTLLFFATEDHQPGGDFPDIGIPGWALLVSFGTFITVLIQATSTLLQKKNPVAEGSLEVHVDPSAPASFYDTTISAVGSGSNDAGDVGYAGVYAANKKGDFGGGAGGGYVWGYGADGLFESYYNDLVQGTPGYQIVTNGGFSKLTLADGPAVNGAKRMAMNGDPLATVADGAISVHFIPAGDFLFGCTPYPDAGAPGYEIQGGQIRWFGSVRVPQAAIGANQPYPMFKFGADLAYADHLSRPGAGGISPAYIAVSQDMGNGSAGACGVVAGTSEFAGLPGDDYLMVYGGRVIETTVSGDALVSLTGVTWTLQSSLA